MSMRTACKLNHRQGSGEGVLNDTCPIDACPSGQPNRDRHTSVTRPTQSNTTSQSNRQTDEAETVIELLRERWPTQRFTSADCESRRSAWFTVSAGDVLWAGWGGKQPFECPGSLRTTKICCGSCGSGRPMNRLTAMSLTPFGNGPHAIPCNKRDSRHARVLEQAEDLAPIRSPNRGK
jgi:hypothetical protein